MQKTFLPKSTIAMATERRVRQLVHASRAVTADRTKFESVCEGFRSVCKSIGQELNVPDFHGSFDEIVAVKKDNPLVTTPTVIGLFETLRAYDDICKYEGEKLGYRGSEWFKACWAGER